jgi:anti-sigma factor RsiW
MQPYLDGVLSDEQVEEAKEHLEGCPGCEKRYRFEVTLRRYVRVAVSESISPELKEKLVGLRSSEV